MADPVYTRFKIVGGNSSDCTQAAPDPSKDPCKIDVFETNLEESFVLERSGDRYSVAAADKAKVARLFPSYSPPARQIGEYLLVRSEFFKLLGDKAKPAAILKQIKLSGGQSTEEVLEGWTNYVASFISHGSLSPNSDASKKFQEDVIGIMTYMSVDPTLNTLVGKILTAIKSNPKLSAEAKKRAEWLLVVQSVREKIWQIEKPMMDKSQGLSDELKMKSSQILTFLMANHLMADKGYANYLYSSGVQKTAQNFDDILSKIDSSYDSSKNYYAYMSSVMRGLKSLDIPTEYLPDFRQRVNFVEAEYEKKGQQETLTLLAAKPEETAYREYLRIKYGQGAHRGAALDIFLKRMKVKSKPEAPIPSVDMVGAATDIRTWIDGLPADQQKSATDALLSLLKELFERNSKIQIYWGKKVQESDDFYNSFPIMGAQKTALEDLIVWARRKSKSESGLPPVTPHVGLRKWTLTSELAIGATGFTVAAAMIPLQYSDGKYYGQGAGVILGASGLGAAAGNALSYAFDVDKHSWAFDFVGALVGGAVGGLVYGFTVNPNPWSLGPQPPGPVDPGTRYPVDPYGP
ncbi:MAG TPA: hypothetical protein VJR29_00110 [bacterium]|nr:hypothetical protein [bacterium]